jgi:hypothetical protein
MLMPFTEPFWHSDPQKTANSPQKTAENPHENRGFGLDILGVSGKNPQIHPKIYL